MHIIIYAIMGIAILSHASRVAAQQIRDFFPLSEGNYWIYSGKVKWTESVGGIRETPITWKMQVTRRLKNGTYEVALIKGHPKDLCWYEPGQRPTDYLIVWKAQNYYLIYIDKDLDRLIGDESYLSGRADFDSLFLVDPLKQGLEFGMEIDDKRSDHMYRWLVNNEEMTRLPKVRGIDEQKAMKKYTLAYRTNPDHQIVDFVPSVGITRFIYVHHGTVSEVDVRLIEFGKGTPVEKSKKSCREHPMLSGSCFKIRGRMSLSNGTPSVRIWPVGTNRILGVSEGRFYLEDYANVPGELVRQLSWETAMYADFTVCPFNDDEPGVMRLICVESAENISIRKWK